MGSRGFALRLLGAIEQDPATVYEAIGNFYKLNNGSDNTGGSGQGQDGPSNNTTEDPYASRFSELERQSQIMAQALVQNRQNELQAQAEAQLDQELSQMREKYKSQGDFDEKFVLAYMSNGMPAEDAVKAFYEFRDGMLDKHGQKPLIMGTGGGVPQFNNTDVRKLSDKDTRNLVVQFLEHAAAERRR